MCSLLQIHGNAFNIEKLYTHRVEKKNIIQLKRFRQTNQIKVSMRFNSPSLPLLLILSPLPPPLSPNPSLPPSLSVSSVSPSLSLLCIPHSGISGRNVCPYKSLPRAPSKSVIVNSYIQVGQSNQLISFHFTRRQLLSFYSC